MKLKRILRLALLSIVFPALEEKTGALDSPRDGVIRSRMLEHDPDPELLKGILSGSPKEKSSKLVQPVCLCPNTSKLPNGSTCPKCERIVSGGESDA